MPIRDLDKLYGLAKAVGEAHGLKSEMGAGDAEILCLHERTGRLLGSNDFITRLESEPAGVLPSENPDPKEPSKGIEHSVPGIPWDFW